MNLKETFAKQGGMKLIKQYLKAGALPVALGEFILLGKSRTALEILRLAVQLKTRKRLEKKYRKTLEAFDRNYVKREHQETSKKVFICWLQGIEHAPQLVQRCFESVKQNLTDREVILITKDNFENYTNLPEYILEKWRSGIITDTHFSDLLRLELLTKNGGTWLDATVLCTSKRECIPDYFFDSELFFYQMLKPGRDGNCQYISSWLITAKAGNIILSAALALCCEYWKKNNSLADYFLLHSFISMALDYYPEEWKRVVPRDNAAPHILLLRIQDRYDEMLFQEICAQTPFHKLSYKLEEPEDSDSFYRVILDGRYLRQQ